MDNSDGNFYRGTGANSLRKAEENAAAAKMDDTEDSTSGVQKAETGVAQGYYRAEKERQTIRKGKVRGVFKKKGVTGLLIGLIFGGMVLVGGSQAMQPFSLLAQFKETYNSMQVSAATRPMLKFQLQGITGNSKWFGNNGGNLSASQQSSLAAQGIDYDSDSRTLNFKGSNGGTVSVGADDLDNTIATNPTFANKYTGGTKGWRGAISNWFNKITDKFISSNALTRNLFSKFQSKKAEAGGDEEAALIKDMSTKGNANLIEKNSKSSLAWEETDTETVTVGYDDKGFPQTEEQTVTIYPKKDETLPGSTTPQTTEGIKTKLSGVASKFAKAGQLLSLPCTVSTVLNGIVLVMMAQEMLKIINLTTGIFEGIDKAKSGDGNESPINAIGNALNQNRTNKFTVPGEVSGSVESISIETREETTTKTAMESASTVSLYSGQPVDVNDPSIQSFNIAKTATNIMSVLGLFGDYKTCLQIRQVAAAANAVATIAAGPVKNIGEWAFSRLALAGFSAIVGAVVGALVPVVAKMMARDLIGNLGGEDLGNALTSGANIYMGNAHRANGGSLSTKDKYIAYEVGHQQVIAENARYERATKNPFDATSNYTFMGTLAKQMMSFAGSNSLLKTLTSAGSVLSSSIMNLVPAASASAYNIGENLDATNGSDFAERCPYLDSIGAVGDAFCNPYIITDSSTINESPSDVADTVQGLDDNFNDDGSIKNGSKLAKYVVFCGRRSSPFGVPDNEIASKVSSIGGDATLNTMLGNIPGLDIAVDLWNTGEALNNLGYITGESCVAGNNANDDGLESVENFEQKYPAWEEAKWYQRFIEDQALLETAGVIDKSVVTAYLEEYDKENPTDNSYEGMLARYSGLSKDEVVAYLDFMDYCEYIAKYDPTERYAFGQDEIEKPILVVDGNNLATAPQFVLLNNIVYADVRNRQTIA